MADLRVFNASIWMICAVLLLPLSGRSAPLRVSEIMASNQTTIADDDGDYSDWIELYNAGTEPITLDGYALSDDPDEPFRWRFPSVQLAPGMFLVVWASGKNRVDPAQSLHTNFKISSSGEAIALRDPNGVVVDSVPAVELQPDISYGRQIDRRFTWYYFEKATPGAQNTTTPYLEIISAPRISHPSGFYERDIEVTLSHSDPAAIVYYTLDGSVPDPANLNGKTYVYKNQYPQQPSNPFGPLLSASYQTFRYESPILIRDRSGDPDKLSLISATWEFFQGSAFWNSRPQNPVFKGTVVRARAVKPDALPSAVVTHSFFVTPEGSDRFTVPVVSLSFNEDDLFGYHNGIYVAGVDYDRWREENPDALPVTRWRLPANYTRRGREAERPVHLEILDPVQGLLLSQSAGMRIQGKDLRAFPQKSLRLYARGSSEFAVDLFSERHLSADDQAPIPTFKRFLLHVVEKWFDVVAHEIMRPGKALGQRSRPMVRFFNGEYWGMVFARDRLDRYFLAKRFGLDPENVIVLQAPWGLSSEEHVQEGLPRDIHLYRAMYTYATRNDLSQEIHFRHVESMLDIDSFIDYNIMFIYLNNRSWHGTSHFRFWRTRDIQDAPFQDGKWRVMIWDFDSPYLDPTFDHLGNALFPEGKAFQGHTPEVTALLRSLLKNRFFRDRFINRFLAHIHSTFHPERVRHIANRISEEIEPEYDEHMQRWNSDYRPNPDVWAIYAKERPAQMRAHLRKHFDLAPERELSIAVSPPEAGDVLICGVSPRDALTDELAGLRENPSTGIYFSGVPIELVAVPQPGYRFAGWQGLPVGTPAKAILDPADVTGTVTALFEPKRRVLIGYWNFDVPNQLLIPSYTRGGIKLLFDEGDNTALTSATGNGFSGANAQFADPAGRHLRVNHPLGASLTFQIPSSGWESIILRYETRRSGQGAGIQQISYTTNGLDYVPFTQIEVLDDDPVVHTLDFTTVEAADNNPAFGVRITFGQGNGGTAGNHRFDNITISAIAPPQYLQFEQIDDRLILSWPLAAEAYILESTERVQDPNSWQVTSLERKVSGDRISVTIEPLSAPRFYRLTLPGGIVSP